MNDLGCTYLPPRQHSPVNKFQCYAIGKEVEKPIFPVNKIRVWSIFNPQVKLAMHKDLQIDDGHRLYNDPSEEYWERLTPKIRARWQGGYVHILQINVTSHGRTMYISSYCRATPGNPSTIRIHSKMQTGLKIRVVRHQFSSTFPTSFFTSRSQFWSPLGYHHKSLNLAPGKQKNFQKQDKEFISCSLLTSTAKLSVCILFTLQTRHWHLHQ